MPSQTNSAIVDCLVRYADVRPHLWNVLESSEQHHDVATDHRDRGPIFLLARRTYGRADFFLSARECHSAHSDDSTPSSCMYWRP